MNDTVLEKQIFDMIVKKMKLQEIIREIPEEKLSYDTPLFESMDPDGIALDSIAALELVVLLQDNFGITIMDEDMAQLISVADIADFVRDRTSCEV